MENCIRIKNLLHLIPREIQVWEPAWAIQPLPDVVSHGGPSCGAGLVCQQREVEQLVSDDIEELGLVHETVDNVLVLFLFLKCSKHPVPDTQPAPVVLIQTIPGICEGELIPESLVIYLFAP